MEEAMKLNLTPEQIELVEAYCEEQRRKKLGSKEASFLYPAGGCRSGAF